MKIRVSVKHGDDVYTSDFEEMEEREIQKLSNDFQNRIDYMTSLTLTKSYVSQIIIPIEILKVSVITIIQKVDD